MNQNRGSRDPAYLKCEADQSCGNMVMHQFLKTRACTIRSEVGLQEAIEELYSCSECGKARRWGLSTTERDRRKDKS